LKALASFQTSDASRYLGMLCNHFGKKVKAACDDHEGWIDFPFGRCELTAEDGMLALRASAADQPLLDQVKQIVASHLERFAFRENPILEWQDIPN